MQQSIAGVILRIIELVFVNFLQLLESGRQHPRYRADVSGVNSARS